MAPTSCWVSPSFILILLHLVLLGRAFTAHYCSLPVNAPILRLLPHFLRLMATGDRIFHIRLALLFLFHYVRNTLWTISFTLPFFFLLVLIAPTTWALSKPPWPHQHAFPSKRLILSSVMIIPSWSHLMRLGIDPTTVRDCVPARHLSSTCPNALLADIDDLLHSWSCA